MRQNKSRKYRQRRKRSRRQIVKQFGGDYYFEDIVFSSFKGEDHVTATKKHILVFNPDVKKTMESEINGAIDILAKGTCDTWLACHGDCHAVLKKWLDRELTSTAYILRVLSKSIISTKESNEPLHIRIVGDSYGTGKWAEDSLERKFRIINDIGPTQSRLIMGFGPSASGKTYWAKNIIEMLHGANPEFPDTFMSIDGGVYREASLVYQTIINTIQQTCIEGLTNLVLSSWKPLEHSLFDSSIVKQSVTEFLLAQKRNYRIHISLYVPETLGDCGELANLRIKHCDSKYSKYIDITDDKKHWLGILFWQHKHGRDCDLTEVYRCTGCEESGQSREKKEGKKYSSGAYDNSMKQGLTELVKAPGGQIIVHNAGRVGGISFIESCGTDVAINTILNSEENMQKYSFITEHEYHKKSPDVWHVSKCPPSL